MLYEKTNYIVKKKVGTTVLHLKVETELPYSLLDCAALLMDAKRAKELDGAKVIHDIVKVVSNHTWVEHIKYTQVRF